jgi:hypothetical protein
MVIDTDKIGRFDTDLARNCWDYRRFCLRELSRFSGLMRRKSNEGMSPRMGAIMGAFQILWVYYGLLIASRPVIIWNVIAVFINFLAVGAYAYFLRKEKSFTAATGSKSSS